MRFIRYATSLAGAASVASGLIYHNISSNRRFLISAAAPVNLDIDSIIAKDVDSHIAKYAPVMKHGWPSYDMIRLRGNFVLSYDRRNRNPNWVMEHLTSDMIEAESCGSRSKSRFHEDETIHGYFRATLADYRDSGYDRGHLAAAGNHRHRQRDLDETFVLSNVTPQNEYFNQGIWHTLENHVRLLAKKYGSVYVCSGPLYLPRELSAEEEQVLFQESQPKKRKRKKNQLEAANSQKPKKFIIYEVIGDNNVAVPTHFFKIILCEVKENLYDMEAYVIPNQRVDPKQPLQTFMVPRDAIERAAGFFLFHQLPSNNLRKINGEKTENL